MHEIPEWLGELEYVTKASIALWMSNKRVHFWVNYLFKHDADSFFASSPATPAVFMSSFTTSTKPSPPARQLSHQHPPFHSHSHVLIHAADSFVRWIFKKKKATVNFVLLYS